MVGVDGDAVAEPGHDPGLGVAARRVAPELRLAPHLDVGRVGRRLEVFPQNWKMQYVIIIANISLNQNLQHKCFENRRRDIQSKLWWSLRA